MPDIQAPVDPTWYRQVLGQYPTGVCVICATQADGAPTGMVVGSFTSVSLNPPLVAFLADRKSGTWARLRELPRFCVNIFSAEQEQLCRKLASKEPDKFAGLSYQLSSLGSPILDGVVAWIDCDVHSIDEAGDHFIVLGLVRQLEIANGGLPLLFFQGGYGRFAPSSMMTVDTHELLTEQLRVIDCARPEMESIAADVQARCVAQTRVGDEIIIVASAGQPSGDTPPVLIGQRVPFMAPFGTVFAAYFPQKELEEWVATRSDPARREECRRAIAAIRERGYSVGLLNEARRKLDAKLEEIAVAAIPAQPADLKDLILGLAYDPPELTAEACASIRYIGAPVFDSGGNVALSILLRGFPLPASETEIAKHVARLLQGTRRLTAQLGGHEPDLSEGNIDATRLS